MIFKGLAVRLRDIAPVPAPVHVQAAPATVYSASTAPVHVQTVPATVYSSPYVITKIIYIN